jgi:hypothetical protein
VITNKDGLKVNVATGVEVTKKDYAIMKQKGSQDLYDGYYYKKVYTDNMDQFGNRLPLRTYNKKIDGYDYYYKLINVYGDGPRAVEYNTEFGRSVINNGSVQIDKELDDRDIVNFFAPQIEEEVVSLEEPTVEPVVEEETIIEKPIQINVPEVMNDIGSKVKDLKTGRIGVTNNSFYEGYVNVLFENGDEFEINKKDLELVPNIKPENISLTDQNNPEGLPPIDRSPKQC